MSHQLLSLLQTWYPQRDNSEWVLGVLYQTLGSSYRKAGALMFFGSEGQQLGMLSGGCLESDLHSKARRIMANQRSKIVVYDGTDEDDMSFQMGIGCGGRVEIMLQVIDRANDYLGLDIVLAQLQANQTVKYSLLVGDDLLPNEHKPDVSKERQECACSFSDSRLNLCVTPPPHLFIGGGGIDARPLVDIAHSLGWQISLWDPRPAHGRVEHFPKVDNLFDGDIAGLEEFLKAHPCDAAIAMTHSVSLDAAFLKVIVPFAPSYLALLGPEHRLKQVIDVAGIERPIHLAGPAGLSIGGQLPETIALSILAECQAKLAGRQGGSMSGIL